MRIRIQKLDFNTKKYFGSAIAMRYLLLVLLLLLRLLTVALKEAAIDL
jgi:hypothetical protein